MKSHGVFAGGKFQFGLLVPALVLCIPTPGDFCNCLVRDDPSIDCQNHRPGFQGSVAQQQGIGSRLFEFQVVLEVIGFRVGRRVGDVGYIA